MNIVVFVCVCDKKLNFNSDADVIRALSAFCYQAALRQISLNGVSGETK